MADSLYLSSCKKLMAPATCFNLFILLFVQIPEVYPWSFPPLGNKKPLEKNVLIQASETYVIPEDLRISSSTESVYRETNATNEENILNLSSIASTNAQHTQQFIAATSPSIHHKINSSVENNLRVNITVSSSPFPDIGISSSKGYSYGETKEKNISNPLTRVTMSIQHTQRFIAMTSPPVHHKINPPIENNLRVNITVSYGPFPEIGISSSKGYSYGETREENISNLSTPVTMSIQHTQRFIAMTSPPVHHKINSTVPPFVENEFLPSTVNLTDGSSPFPQEVDQSNKTVTSGLLTTTNHSNNRSFVEVFNNTATKDYVTTQYALTEPVCNYSECNSTLNKARISMNSLKKKYFNTEYYRNELKTLCARSKYLSSCSNSNYSGRKVFQKEYHRFQQDYRKFLKELYTWKIVLKYIDPVLYAIILTMGVGGNGMLVIIFVRRPGNLTSPNIVVLVIAVCDILALLFIAPLDYVTEFYGAALIGDTGCKMYIYIRLIIRSVTELCLVILSGQRFLSTISLGRRGTLKARLASRWFIWKLMIAVWITSTVFCIPTFFVIEFTDGTCFPHIKDNTIAQLFFFVIITFFVMLPLPMVVFSGLTALRLGRTTKEDFPHTRRSRLLLPRYRSARVIAMLAICYACAFIPRTLWDAFVCWRHLNRRSILYFSIDQLINFMYFADSCSMPFILFFLSSVYRNMFRRFWKAEYRDPW